MFNELALKFDTLLIELTELLNLLATTADVPEGDMINSLMDVS